MSRRDEWLEFWERRETPFLRALPYALLVLCIGFDVATRHGFDRTDDGRPCASPSAPPR